MSRHGAAARGQDGNDTGLGLFLRLSAEAVTRRDALFCVNHMLRQAVGSQHDVTLVGLIRPAHRRGVRLRHLPNLFGKSVGQLLQGACSGDKSSGLVQRHQTGMLRFQLQGFFLNPCFQVLIQALQGGGHAVESFGQQTELVLTSHFHAGGEVALLHA